MFKLKNFTFETHRPTIQKAFQWPQVEAGVRGEGVLL
jgi:hypothetical protein